MHQKGQNIPKEIGSLQTRRKFQLANLFIEIFAGMNAVIGLYAMGHLCNIMICSKNAVLARLHLYYDVCELTKINVVL